MRKRAAVNRRRRDSGGTTDGFSAQTKLRLTHAQKATIAKLRIGWRFQRVFRPCTLEVNEAIQERTRISPASFVKLSAEPPATGESSKNMTSVKATTPMERFARVRSANAIPQAAPTASFG